MGLSDHLAADSTRRDDPNRPTTRQVTVEAQWTVRAPADEQAVTEAFRKAEAYRQSLGGPTHDVIPRPIQLRPQGDGMVVVLREQQSHHEHPVEITEKRPPVHRDAAKGQG